MKTNSNKKGVLLKNVEPEIKAYILKQNPDFTEEKWLNFSELTAFRLNFIGSMLQTDSKKIAALNKEILDNIQSKDILVNQLEVQKTPLSFGQKLADKIAKFGGSWSFILLFISVLLFWVISNSYAWFGRNFDPFPFILLNLVLSCIAALQAPLILMSQNRQAENDRESAMNDYKINLKAEIEIKLLHEKMDYLLETQWEHLIQIQQIEVELLEQIQEQADMSKKNKTSN